MTDSPDAGLPDAGSPDTGSPAAGSSAVGARARPSGRWLGVVMAIVAVVAVGAWFARKGTRSVSELPVYTTGAQRMLEGAEIYRPTDAKPFTYPPFFALPFVPLGLFGSLEAEPPRSIGPVLGWFAIQVVVLALLGWLVHGVLRREREHALARGGSGPPLWAGWLVVALLAGRHVSAALENQSHDLLVLLPIALAYAAWRANHRGLAGAWCGLGAACKATPLLFGLLFTVRWSVRGVLGLGLAAIGATLLPDLLCPRADGSMWVVAWINTFLTGLRPGETAAAAGAWNADSFLNQSLSGTLHRLVTPTTDDPSRFMLDIAPIEAPAGARSALILGASLAVIGWLAWLGWRRRGESEGMAPIPALAQFGAIVCGMVLLSPMSSKSHFCVLLLPASLVAARLLWAPQRDPILAVLAVAWFALGTLTMKGLVGRSIGNVWLAYGAVTWTTVLALLAMTRVARSVRAQTLSTPA